MSFADNIKAKIKDVDVEKQLTELVDEGEKLVNDAVTKAGEVAHDKRDDVEGWLDKATGAINDKTEGKYADQVSKVRDTLLGGLDKLAQRRTSDASAADPVAPQALTEGDAAGDGAADPVVDPAAPEGPSPTS